MAKVWSVSQQKIIDTDTNQSASGVVSSGPQDTDPDAALRAQYAALMQANPKQYTALKAIYEMKKSPDLTAAQSNAIDKKKDTERVMKQLEDFYFQNKLYYGNNTKGIYSNLLAPVIEPDSPAALYKAYLMSNAPYFAKATGDAGNIAISEQKQAIKPFPTTRFSKTSAIKSFGQLRKKLGLSERDYTDIGVDTQTGLQTLGVQYGGKGGIR